MQLRGIFAPATTPFDAAGDIDVAAMDANLAAWMAHPLAGIVLFGTTGEGPLLTGDERRTLTAAARPRVGGGRLLLAGAGAESTRATIHLARVVAAEGADAVLVQPPGFFRALLTPAALRDHFLAVADASPVPVILYQVPPSVSGAELPPALVHELVQHPNVAGIKDSHGSLRAIGELVAAVGDRGSVLAGSGAILHDALAAGATGGILAVSLLDPGGCAALFLAFDQERMDDSLRIQERIAALHRAVVAGFGVPGMKAALDALGLHGGAPRAPVQPLADAAAVHAALRAATLLPAAAEADA